MRRSARLAAAAQDRPHPTSLMDLPPELHHAIAANLDFPAYVCLKYVNSYFNQLIKPMTLAQLRKAEISFFAIKKRVVACSACLRLRKPLEFSDEMRKSVDTDRRVCIDCSVRDMRTDNEKGDVISWSDLRHVICTDCDEFKTMSPRKISGICYKCWKHSASTEESRRRAWEEKYGYGFRQLKLDGSLKLHHALVCRGCYRDLYRCPSVQACLSRIDRSALCRKCLVVTSGCCPQSYFGGKSGTYRLTLLKIDNTIRSIQKPHVSGQPVVVGAKRGRSASTNAQRCRATIKSCWKSRNQANRQGGGDLLTKRRIQ